MRSPRFLTAAAGLAVLALLSTACSGGSSPSAPGDDAKPVTLTFWSWVPDIDKIVSTWNTSHPQIQVQVSKPAQGDALITKILAADKAGKPPDLMQAEYQALPTLVTNGVAADISSNVSSADSAFTSSTWKQVTFGGKRYAVPQDVGPMMYYYREDLFKQYGLSVPKTWDQFAAQARALHAKHPSVYLAGFSDADPGWFTGLAAQAGGKWWDYDGSKWTVGANDAATKKVAGYWNGMVSDGSIDGAKWWTPDWNKKLSNGTIISWVSSVWAPGVLGSNAGTTKGKWAMAPLPQWQAGDNVTGNWGGSSTAIAAKSKHRAEAAEFALWLNTDANAAQGLITKGFIYPASIVGQGSPALAKAPDVMAADQSDFYIRAKAIAGTATGFTWGPDVNVAYNAYSDAFGKALQNKTPFSAALDVVQAATVADMKKAGFALTND